MTSAAPKMFRLPPTGRMSHNQPEIQILPPSGPVGSWAKELDRIRDLQKQSKLTGKVFEVSRQEKLNRGDLVVWAPAGQPGLWRVTDVSRWQDPGEVDYKSMEKAVAAASNRMADEMADEVDDNIIATLLAEQGITARNIDVPRGKVRLEWEGGWGGWANDRLPVMVPIKDVRLANEMEALGIAAL